jgi:hypothetical protein
MFSNYVFAGVQSHALPRCRKPCICGNMLGCCSAATAQLGLSCLWSVLTLLHVKVQCCGVGRMPCIIWRLPNGCWAGGAHAVPCCAGYVLAPAMHSPLLLFLCRLCLSIRVLEWLWCGEWCLPVPTFGSAPVQCTECLHDHHLLP